MMNRRKFIQQSSILAAGLSGGLPALDAFGSRDREPVDFFWDYARTKTRIRATVYADRLRNLFAIHTYPWDFKFGNCVIPMGQFSVLLSLSQVRQAIDLEGTVPIEAMVSRHPEKLKLQLSVGDRFALYEDSGDCPFWTDTENIRKAF